MLIKCKTLFRNKELKNLVNHVNRVSIEKLLEENLNAINKIIKKALSTLPRNIDIEYDAKVNLKNLSEYKRHPGKYTLKTVQIPDQLEKAINTLISSE
jgi:hypothetical protein